MSIWFSPPRLEDLNAASEGTMIRHLDILFCEVGDDFIRASMPVDERTRQPYGLLHGGASVVLAETLGSMGAMMCVDPTLFRCVGQEINANHVRAGRRGRVIGTARPIHLGGRSHVWTVEIHNDARELVCVSRMTIAVVNANASGRTP